MAEIYPRTEFGQKAYLDLGIMSFLQRDLNKSLSYLMKINPSTLPERDYWLAQIFLKQNENGKAIQYGQSYLRTASDQDKMENTYYIIANAYINQGDYDNVQTLLTKLDRIPNLPRHKVYYSYLRGYAYDRANNDDKALEYYKSIYTLDRYSQYAFLTEERLFAMKARKKNHLDISFIYPDSVYHPPVEVPDTAKTIIVTLPTPGEEQPIESVPDSITMVQNTGHGIFLQMGRFSSEQNAQKLMIQLKDDNFNAFYFPSQLDGKVSYRVLIGPFKTKALAEKMKKKLLDKTYGCIIVTR
jgi:tetratricopeptide (TPR) repeat protein